MIGRRRRTRLCAGTAYEAGLTIDPANDQLKSGLEDVKAAAARANGGGGGDGDDPMGNIGAMLSSPELYGKLAMDPQTRGFLAQPDFIAMLTDVQKNPQQFGKYMSDPRMMKVLSVALGVSVMSGDEAANGGMFNGAAGGGAGGDGASTADKPAAAAAKKSAAEPAPMEVEEPATGPKAEAKKEKELGNAAYKAKNFDVALEHYNKAIALDPEDISFITNKAAVNFEKQDYEECIKNCDDAVEKGRELRVDYKLVARAMTRKGNALVKQGNLEAAIEQYQKSLMEHRNADTLTRLNNAEKTLKDNKIKAYLCPEKAEEARTKGNDLFKEQKYPEAVEQYTESIKRNPDDHRREDCLSCLSVYSHNT